MQLLLFNLAANRVQNSPGALSVPRFWHGAGNLRCELLPSGLANTFLARSRKDIGADLHRDRPLCILSHGDAWNAKAGGFFLDATGIGHDHGRVRHQAEKVKISKRLNQADAPICLSGARILSVMASVPGSEETFKTELGEFLLRSRVRGENYGTGVGQLLQSFQDIQESRSLIHVGRPMKSQQGVAGRAIRRSAPAVAIPEA
jgi:hypothetical protein